LRLREVARVLEAVIFVQGDDRNVQGVHAADTVSELLQEASPTTLLVTRLSGQPLARIAQLMDAPGVCIVNGVEPDEALVSMATRGKTGLLLTQLSSAEVCERLRSRLRQMAGRTP